MFFVDVGVLIAAAHPRSCMPLHGMKKQNKSSVEAQRIEMFKAVGNRQFKIKKVVDAVLPNAFIDETECEIASPFTKTAEMLAFGQRTHDSAITESDPLFVSQADSMKVLNMFRCTAYGDGSEWAAMNDGALPVLRSCTHGVVNRAGGYSL